MFGFVESSIKAGQSLGWRALWGSLLCFCSAHLPAGEISLAWDPSVSDNLGGYRLYYGQSSGHYTSTIDVGLQTTYTLTGLAADQAYFFAVTAYNSARTAESGFSNEISITLPASTGPTLDPNITVRIEEPIAEDTKSGVANFRGFATTPSGDCPIERVELFIDGAFQGNIPLGGGRIDVCGVFDNPDCATSGFSQTMNYSTFDEGPHDARVRPVDCFGNFNEASVSFSTDRFADSFISDSQAVDFRTTRAFILNDGLDKRIFLQSVSAGGHCYDMTLDYATEIQGWKIVSIQERPEEECF